MRDARIPRIVGVNEDVDGTAMHASIAVAGNVADHQPKIDT